MRKLNVALGLLLCGLLSCANWSTHIRRSLSVLAQAQIETLKVFEAYEKEKQTEFRTRADNATSMGEIDRIDADFAEWRKKRDTVTAAFNAFYTSLKVTETTVPLVEEGLKKPADVEALLSFAMKSFTEVRDLLSELGIVVKGL